MKILVINCGSSSLKYQLINPETEEVFAKGICERIGIDGSKMEYEVVAKDFEKKLETPMPSHKEALELVISHLTDKEIGVIASVDEVDAIGHRVVHRTFMNNRIRFGNEAHYQEDLATIKAKFT